VPVLYKVTFELDVQDILRRQEINKSSRIQPTLKNVTLELIKNKDVWLEPTLAYNIFSIAEVQPAYIILQNGQMLHLSPATEILKQASEIAIVICTIGPLLEKAVDEYFKSGQSMKGFLLDGLGSAAVDSLAQKACDLINSDAVSGGLSSSSPYSPGMHGWSIDNLPALFRLYSPGMLGWSIDNLPALFRLVPADQISMSLTSSGMISPRKSIAMVIGIGKDMKQRKPEEMCLLCNLRDSCRHRRYNELSN